MGGPGTFPSGGMVWGGKMAKDGAKSELVQKNREFPGAGVYPIGLCPREPGGVVL